MDISIFEKAIDNDLRFQEIKNNPTMRNNLLVSLARINNSGRIKDSCMHFLRNQRDIARYVDFAKKIANNQHSKQFFPRSYEDTSISEQSMRDDLMAFYYELDILTGGKHKFVEKISQQLTKTTFIHNSNMRSGVGATYDEKGNLIESHINVVVKPLVNSRTVAMHEEWHAIDEKNLGGSLDKEQDQFLGEIGTMFIDKIARDFIVKTHSDDAQLVEKIKLLDRAKNDTMIDKARESYLDYLLVMSIVGAPAQKNNADKEIIDNFGKLWGIEEVKRKIEHLYAVAQGNPNVHFDPMYELRYVVGEAVSQAVYSDTKEPMAEKVDKMATFNENILHTEKLNNNTLVPLDRVTNYLGLPNIEVLIEHMAQELSQQHIKY